MLGIFEWLNPLRRYSDGAMRAVLMSRKVASDVGGEEMTTDHLMLSLLDLGDSEVARILGSEWLDELTQQLRDHAHSDNRVAVSVDMRMSRDLLQALHSARKVSKALSRREVDPAALLLGILQGRHRFSTNLLGQHGVTYETALTTLAGNGRSQSE